MGGRFRLNHGSRGTTAILLRFVEQFDLPLQQLVLELFSRQLELDLAVESRLADRAVVQAALDQNAWRRERGFLLERKFCLCGRSYFSVGAEQPGIRQFLVHLLQREGAQIHRDRLLGWKADGSRPLDQRDASRCRSQIVETALRLDREEVKGSAPNTGTRRDRV